MKAKKRCPKKIIERWQKRLNLTEWQISVVESETPHENDPSSNVVAIINVDTVYLNAYVNVLPIFHTLDFATQEHSLVHELCHVITQEIYNLLEECRKGVMIPEHLARNEVERLTQRIANAVYWNAK